MTKSSDNRSNLSFSIYETAGPFYSVKSKSHTIISIGLKEVQIYWLSALKFHISESLPERKTEILTKMSEGLHHTFSEEIVEKI